MFEGVSKFYKASLAVAGVNRIGNNRGTNEAITESTDTDVDTSSYHQCPKTKSEYKERISQLIDEIPDHKQQYFAQQTLEYINQLSNSNSTSNLTITGVNVEEILNKQYKALWEVLETRESNPDKLIALNFFMNSSAIKTGEFKMPENKELFSSKDLRQEIINTNKQIDKFYEEGDPNRDLIMNEWLEANDYLKQSKPSRYQSSETFSFILNKYQLRETLYKNVVAKFNEIQKHNRENNNLLNVFAVQQYIKNTKSLFESAFIDMDAEPPPLDVNPQDGTPSLKTLTHFLYRRLELLEHVYLIAQRKDSHEEINSILEEINQSESIEPGKEEHALLLTRALNLKLQISDAEANMLDRFKSNNESLLKLLRPQAESNKIIEAFRKHDSRLKKYINPNMLFEASSRHNLGVDIITSYSEKLLEADMRVQYCHEVLESNTDIPEDLKNLLTNIKENVDEYIHRTADSELINHAERVHRLALINILLKPLVNTINSLNKGNISEQSTNFIQNIFGTFEFKHTFDSPAEFLKALNKLNETKIEACIKKHKNLGQNMNEELGKSLDKIRYKVQILTHNKSKSDINSIKTANSLVNLSNQIDFIENNISQDISDTKLKRIIELNNRYIFATRILSRLAKADYTLTNPISAQIVNRTLVNVNTLFTDTRIPLDAKLITFNHITGTKLDQVMTEPNTILHNIEEIIYQAKDYYSFSEKEQVLINKKYAAAVQSIERFFGYKGRLSYDTSYAYGDTVCSEANEDDYYQLIHGEEGFEKLIKQDLLDSSLRDDNINKFKALGEVSSLFTNVKEIKHNSLRDFMEKYLASLISTEPEEQLSEIQRFTKTYRNISNYSTEELDSHILNMKNILEDFTRKYAEAKLGTKSKYYKQIDDINKEFERFGDFKSYTSKLCNNILNEIGERNLELIYESGDARDSEIRVVTVDGVKYAEKTVYTKDGKLPAVIELVKKLGKKNCDFLRKQGITLPYEDSLKIINNGRTFKFRMDYIEGVSFNDANLKQLGGIDTFAMHLYNLVKQAKYLHDKKVLHRDFQGDNYILGKDGKPYIIDFDLAAYTDEPNGEVIEEMNGTSPLGMLHYLDPRIAYTKEDHYVYNPGGDFYSLALSAIGCITGGTCERMLQKDETSGEEVLKLLGTEKEYGDPAVDHIMIDEKKHELQSWINEGANVNVSNLKKMIRLISVMQKFIPNPKTNTPAASPDEVLKDLAVIVGGQRLEKLRDRAESLLNQLGEIYSKKVKVKNSDQLVFPDEKSYLETKDQLEKAYNNLFNKTPPETMMDPQAYETCKQAVLQLKNNIIQQTGQKKTKPKVSQQKGYIQWQIPVTQQLPPIFSAFKSLGDQTVKALRNLGFMLPIVGYSKDKKHYIMQCEVPAGSKFSSLENIGGIDNLIKYAPEVVAKVNALHKQKVLHRQISPENLILGNDGKVYIMSKAAAPVNQKNLTRLEKIRSNPAPNELIYTDPSVRSEDDPEHYIYSKQADRYSLALSLIETATGMAVKRANVGLGDYMDDYDAINKIKASIPDSPDKEKILNFINIIQKFIWTPGGNEQRASVSEVYKELKELAGKTKTNQKSQ